MTAALIVLLILTIGALLFLDYLHRDCPVCHPRRPGTTHVVNTPGLPPGYTPPSASLKPPPEDTPPCPPPC